MTIEAIETVGGRVTLATVEVFERGLVAITDKVDTLNKRAVKYGMELITVRIVSTETVTRKTKAGTEYEDLKHCIEITGCEPCINGYRLVCRVEFNEFVGTIVHANPALGDGHDLSEYRTLGPICEHCNTKRRRNDVFVLEDLDGRRKVVARNCLADYVRSGDAESLAWFAQCAEWIGSIDPDGGDEDVDCYNRERANPAMSLVPYLRIVAVAKRRFGWLGRTKAREQDDCMATADIAGFIIYGKGSYHEEFVERNELYACDDDTAYAERAAEWAAGLDPADSNEYRYTIGQIARAGVVDMRSHDGYAASILIAYDMACERERENAEKAKTARENVFIGSPKERLRNVRVKCVGLHSFEGYYGVTTIVRFEHYPDGPEGDSKAVITWFASGDRYNDWAIDGEYIIDATCKDHDDNEKYGKQTKVNRVKQCKALSVDSDELERRSA